MIPGQVDEFGDIDEVDEVVAEGGWCVPVTDHLVEAQKAHWDAFMAFVERKATQQARRERKSHRILTCRPAPLPQLGLTVVADCA